MEYEDFLEVLSKDYGVSGLASGDYDIDDIVNAREAILAISKINGLGYAELESAVKIALMVNDSEDRDNIIKATNHLQVKLTHMKMSNER